MIDEKFWPKFAPDMSLYDAKMRERELQRREMRSELTASLTTTLTASLQSSLAVSLRPSIEKEVQERVAEQVAAIVATQTQTCVDGLTKVCVEWENALEHKDLRTLSVMVCFLLCHSLIHMMVCCAWQ